MKTETGKRPVVVYVDEQGNQWITLQDAAWLVGINAKTLYSATYRGGTGRRPTLSRLYIKERPNQMRGDLYVRKDEVIAYKLDEVIKDAERVEAELRYTLERHGIDREEADELMRSYARSFSKVIEDVKAKGLEGELNSEEITVH